MEEKLLLQVNSSADVKKLSLQEIPKLCREIREMLIDTVSKNGGHLASNLGTVELTVALHRVFDSESDRLIFDVGHQSYTNKILTGRRDSFDTIRTYGGISGFPKLSEGDAFGTGHSSTSVSAALGIATAMKLQGKDSFAVAVIGDGALTGGLAYEGLNNAGRSGTNIMVLLNENDMSISKNVGAFSEYLSTLASGEGYFNFKDNVKNALKKTPLVGEPLFKAANKAKDFVKTFVEVPERNFFEDIGFTYFGPIDGHNVEAMETAFRRVKKLSRPCVVHVKTVKGKGYSPAEKAPSLYHGVGKFDKIAGIDPAGASKTCFSSEFTDKLCEMAEADSRICAMTAAMTDGVALGNFASRFSDRFFDVGIAEEHAAVFAAGLAKEGMKPVFLCYSSFLQRAYDQILHDVELQELPVVFGIDRAGFVGADGDTHNGLFDVSVFNTFDNTEIYSPANYQQTKGALEKAILSDKIAAVRYPRGAQITLPDELSADTDIAAFDTENADAIIITYGRLCEEALEAKNALDAKGIKTGIILLVKIKPINADKLSALVGNADNIVFAEEGVLSGGIGQSVAPLFTGRKYKICAVKTPFVTHGSVKDQLAMAGIDANSIAKAVLENGGWDE